MFVDNNWYGHRSILAKFCKIKDTNAFASIQHGMIGKLRRKQEKYLGIRKFSNHIPYLCWNINIKKKLDKKKIKNVAIIGAPFLYLDQIFKKKKFKERGTIVFPTKSTYEINRNIDYNSLVNNVEKILPGPYTVSIYHADLNKDLSVFKKKGWKIISFGKRGSKNFLKKNYIEIKKNKNLVSTSISSVFFYGIYLKKNIKFISSYNKTVNTEYWNQDATRDYYKKKYPGILNGRISNKKLYEISLEELGFYYLKTREEIMELMGWNSRIKKFIGKVFANLYDFKSYLEKENLRND